MYPFDFSSTGTRLTDGADFADALGPESTLTVGEQPADASFYRLPDLVLLTGEIVASDGFMREREPFMRRVAPGRYPVTIAIAEYAKEQRIALAQVRFSSRPVVRWEMALCEGEDPATLDSGHNFGYPVDSGTGCFADPKAINLINEADDPQMKFFKKVTREMDKSYQHTRSWVRIDTPQGSAVLFSSGGSDGTYPSFFGLDDADEPVVLLTDFYVSTWRRPTWGKTGGNS